MNQQTKGVVMDFKKYPSLTNHYQNKHIENCLNEYDGLWNVFEKIHGANMSFHCDGLLEIKAARRNGFLEDGEPFFGFNNIREEVLKDISIIMAHVGPCIIYGELYGKGVQREINYKDTQDFIVFDIEVDGQMLPYAEVLHWVAKTNLQVVASRFTGSLQECLAFSPEFSSGHSPYDEIAEGLVLKPVTPFYTKAGHLSYIKHKAEAFMEKKATKVTKPKDCGIDPFLLSEALSYINTNRVDAVLSKEGEMTMQDLPQLANWVYNDAVDDMIKDGVEFDKPIMKRVMTQCFIESKKRVI